MNENKGLYAELGNKNVSDINLSNANLVVGKNITGESTDGSGVLTFDLAASSCSIDILYFDLQMHLDSRSLTRNSDCLSTNR